MEKDKSNTEKRRSRSSSARRSSKEPTKDAKHRSRSKRRSQSIEPVSNPKTTSNKASNNQVSVMEAMSQLDHKPKKMIQADLKEKEAQMKKASTSKTRSRSTSKSKYTEPVHTQKDLLTSLGLNDSQDDQSSTTKRLLDYPTTKPTPRRSVSNSSMTKEEKKQSIRASRARARSRSRSQSTTRSTKSEDADTKASLDTAGANSSLGDCTPTKIKSTQQLIWLRHAARCPYGLDSKEYSTRGPCPIHKHCADMKKLLDHMITCHPTTSSKDCSFPSCSSSQGLLEVIYPHGIPEAKKKQTSSKSKSHTAAEESSNTSASKESSKDSDQAQYYDGVTTRREMEKFMEEHDAQYKHKKKAASRKKREDSSDMVEVNLNLDEKPKKRSKSKSKSKSKKKDALLDARGDDDASKSKREEFEKDFKDEFNDENVEDEDPPTDEEVPRSRCARYLHNKKKKQDKAKEDLLLHPEDSSLRYSMTQSSAESPSSVLLGHDIEKGESHGDDDQAEIVDDTLEQQSLIQAEIDARRRRLAPKASRGNSNSTRGNQSGKHTNRPSSMKRLTDASHTVAREIRSKAEALLQRVNQATGTKDDISPSEREDIISMYDADGYIEDGSYRGIRKPKNQWNWPLIRKYGCIGTGFFLFLTSICIFLLYLFGGEEWDEFASHFEANSTDNGEHGVAWVPVDSRPAHGSPTSPAPIDLTVQNDAPAMAPIPFIEALPDYTVELLEKDGFSNENDVDGHLSDQSVAPQTLAYDWVISEQDAMEQMLDAWGWTYDQAKDSGDIFSIGQWKNRFALATLYFSTIAATNGIEQGTGRAKSMKGKPTNWTYSENWLELGVSECEWAFYGCHRGDSLWITDNGLHGTLPPEMGMLTRIKDLAIMNNHYLTGPIPTQLGLLHNTESVNFQGNSLSGEIPSEINTMKHLRWLYLNNNRLRSTLPPELGQLSRLAYLWLNDNRLTGSIDPQMFTNSGFKYLEEMLLHNNKLTGTIPPEMAQMSRIRFISLHQNSIVGTIPTTLGMLSNLEVLKLHDTQLTGSVPTELCHLLQRGTLKSLTVDCSMVTCDCGCSCSNPPNDALLPPNGETSPPVSAPVQIVVAAPFAPISGAPLNPDIAGVGVPGSQTDPLGESPTGILPLAPLDTSPPVSQIATKTPTAEPSPTPTQAPVAQTEPPVSAAPTDPPTDRPTAPPTSAVSTDLIDSTNEGTFETTFYPNAFDAVTEVTELMVHLPDFTKDALLNETSPQSMALRWLQEDPTLSQQSIDRRLQRLAMATLYHSTGGPQWKANDNWLDYSVHECDWYTPYDNEDICITSSHDGERYITDLMQWENDLSGPLPPEIVFLTHLEKLFLGLNNITSLPTEIGLMSKSLMHLNMMHCTLEGIIPSEIGLLTLLERLDLSENFLEGSIPSELGLLNLQNLYLNHNYLAGHLPVDLFNMTSLQGFNVAVNALSGPIPTEIGHLKHVHWLNLYGNWISGTIPSEVGHLHKMVALHASHNMLSGPLPSSLSHLKTSESLSLDFRYNELTGSVPSELGELTNLMVLALEGNKITGEMPGAICGLAHDWKLQTLSLDCSAIQCTDELCAGSPDDDNDGQVCICPVIEEYDDDDGAANDDGVIEDPDVVNEDDDGAQG